MSNFIQRVGWMLLVVFSAVAALALFILGVTRLIDGSAASGIFLLLITIISGVVSFAAFKQV